jgi:hypothetical protein
VSKRLRRILLHAGSFALAGVLLYLAFRNVDVARLEEALRSAAYGWLVPLAAIVLVSHTLRAWRWQVLMRALPAGSDDKAQPATLEASFSSLMIGYMVNYVAPRMGELTRTANLAARTNRRFSRVFGTVVVERIFDTVVLGGIILSVVPLVAGQAPKLMDRFGRPILAQLEQLPVGFYAALGGAGVVLLALLAWGVRRALTHEDSRIRRFWVGTVRPAWRAFRDGITTLRASEERGVIVVTTLGMWFAYLLMAYIPFLMLDLAGPYSIGLTDAWIIMAIGALGMVVPTPGGLGSYHYVTIEALALLYAVPQAEAFSYAVLVHGAQAVFYILIGGLCLLAQGLRPGQLLRTAREESEEASAVPLSSESLSGDEDPASVSEKR